MIKKLKTMFQKDTYLDTKKHHFTTHIPHYEPIQDILNKRNIPVSALTHMCQNLRNLPVSEVTDFGNVC